MFSKNTTPTEKPEITVTFTYQGKDSKSFGISRLLLLKGLCLAMISVLAMDCIPSIAHNLYEKHENNELRPKMEMLASQGQEQASLWLIRHYFYENQHRLNSLVKSENPEAMFYKGLISMREGRIAEAKTFIKKAADKGFEPALRYGSHLDL